MRLRRCADGLTQHNRHALVRQLHHDGHTDVEIAELTLMTTYTTVRIRSSLGLAPNLGGGRLDGVVQGGRRAGGPPEGPPTRP